MGYIFIFGRIRVQSHENVRVVDDFYIHRSVHRESNWITVQKDATVLSLLHFCRQLYMFRVFDTRHQELVQL